MNIAGGPVHGDDEWPTPPIAVPRGMREQAWHAGLLASVIGLVAFPEVRAPVLLLSIALILIRGALGQHTPPWLLRRIAAGMIVIAGIATSRWLETGQLRRLALDMLLRRTDLSTLELTEWVAVQVVLWATAAHIVATVTGFDLRVVNRQVADERAWQRQQARRRQVMAQHHRRNPPPECV